MALPCAPFRSHTSSVCISGHASLPPAGRSLIATAHTRAGRPLAVLPSPLLAVPSSSGGSSSSTPASSSCSWCLSPHSSASPSAMCTGCRTARYCSSPTKKCQKNHWKQVHGGRNGECAALRRSGRGWMPVAVRALLQVILLMGSGEEGGDVNAEVRAAFGWGEAHSLEGNVEGFRRERSTWADFELQVRAALTYAGREVTAASLARYMEVFCKIQTNAFNRLDPDTNSAGIHIDATLAMANHACARNALVTFEGRTATIWALQDIQVGDQVTISYADNSLPKLVRLEGLRAWHFDCACSWCERDLDVYAACLESPALPLNACSLVPDISKLRNRPAEEARCQRMSKPRVESIYKAWSVRGSAHDLRARWSVCRPLVEARMWAIEPLPVTLVELLDHVSPVEQNLAMTLSLACFLAVHCDPYKYVAPFEPYRVKRVMGIARVLSQTAPVVAEGKVANICRCDGLADSMRRCDQVSMCEGLVRLVLRWGPCGSSAETLQEARELLADIENLPGRETESSLLRAWIRNPAHRDGDAFFRAQILGPIEKMASYAIPLVEAKLGPTQNLIESA